MRRVTVEPVAFLFILTVYCEYTVLQEMIATKLCFHITNDDDAGVDSHNDSSVHTCNRSALSPGQRQRLSADLSSEMRLYMGLFSACAVVASLFTGSWSDARGRKPLILLPSALGLVAELLFALCSVFLARDRILVLVYVAAVFNGISGGSTTTVSSCFGYIADITDAHSRTRRITLLEAAFFVGGFIGFNVGGQLLRHIVGHRFEHVFALCFLLHLCIIAYTLSLQETRGPRRTRSLAQQEQREQEEAEQLDAVFSLRHAKLMLLTVGRRRRSRCSILLLMGSGFISFIAMSVQLTLLFTYVKSSPFDWDAAQYSLFNGVNFLTTGACLMSVAPLLSRTRLPDAGLALLGFASKLLFLLNLSLSRSTTQLYVGVALAAFSEFTMPAIRSMLSKLVEADERGKAFAFLGLLQNVCSFAGSIAFPSLYRASLTFFPGLAFAVAAGLQLVPATLVL